MYISFHCVLWFNIVARLLQFLTTYCRDLDNISRDQFLCVLKETFFITFVINNFAMNFEWLKNKELKSF